MIDDDVEYLTPLENELQQDIKKYRKALEQVLIKIDWNSDEFETSKQYNETREIVLKALGRHQRTDK